MEISEYNCPTCNWEPPEYNGVLYSANKQKYPRFENEYKGYNGWNDTQNWDEVHFCKKCKKEFTIHNGI